MTGKDLFASLNYVDDALIEEAETYAPARILPLRSVRRIGALAACICVLVGLTAAIRLGLFGGGKNEAMDSGAMMYTESFAESEAACAEEAETEEEMPEIETGEGAADTEKEDALATNTTTGAQPTDKPVAEEDGEGEDAAGTVSDVKYVILNQAFPDMQNDGNVRHAEPENGSFIMDEELQRTVGQLALTNTSGVPRLLVSFDLYNNGEKLDTDSAEYAEEVGRLAQIGYEFRSLTVEHKDKSVRTQPCFLASLSQLKMFEASEAFGYFIYFPKNEDGTPLEWDDTAELCGLPTVE